MAADAFSDPRQSIIPLHVSRAPALQKGLGGMPPFEPTAEQREIVYKASGFCLPHTDIINPAHGRGHHRKSAHPRPADAIFETADSVRAFGEECSRFHPKPAL